MHRFHSFFATMLAVLKFLFVLALLNSCSEPEPLTVYDITDAYDVILVMGQSNTHSGHGLDPAIDVLNPRVRQLGRFRGYNYKVIPGLEPLDHHTRSSDRIGFALTFAKLYANELPDTTRKVLIIPAGHGGTGFSNGYWNRGDRLYEDALSRVRYVLEHSPNSQLKAILWHQGESDVGNPDYESALNALISGFRADLQDQSVPVIVGGMVPYWVNQETERIAQQEIIKTTPMRKDNTGYADPTEPTIIEKPDNTIDEIHYDAAGMRELGVRYFNVYQEM